jgi:hypothetical protein
MAGLRASHDEIIEAAKLASADEFIVRIPSGYDTLMGNPGLTLSGGLRQRVGIARAIIRQSPILILDEPTAATLDTESEKLVIDALERLMKGRTVITIAHRLSTIRRADKIIVLKDGFVAEQGTHDELLSLKRRVCRASRREGEARRDVGITQTTLANSDVSFAHRSSRRHRRTDPQRRSIREEDAAHQDVRVLGSLGARRRHRRAQTRGEVRVMLNPVRRGGEHENEATHHKLVLAGVTVLDSNPAFEVTHEKSMLVDDETALVKSLNWESKNLTETRDYAVVTAHRHEVDEIAKCFEADWHRKPFDPGEQAHLILVQPERTQPHRAFHRPGRGVALPPERAIPGRGDHRALRTRRPPRCEDPRAGAPAARLEEGQASRESRDCASSGTSAPKCTS